MFTKQDAAERVREFVEINLPRQYLCRGEIGKLPRRLEAFVNGEDLNIGWESGWSVSCSLRLCMDDAPSITWPSTHRGLTEVVACLALYRQVVEFAALFDAYRLEQLSYVREAS